MSEKDVSAFREAFEIMAIDAAYESNLPSGVMAHLSSAISLKRIADFLDAVKAEDEARKAGR